jgi:cell division protease FtsH
MTARFRPAWLEGHRVHVAALRRADVVGIGHVLSEIDALIARLRDPVRAAAMGVEPPRGILLWGEPGLGKTLVARYLAASLGADVPFYEVSADELTPDRIRGALHYLAQNHERSILYLDEIDTIGMNRDYGGHDPDTRLRLTALLAGLDGIISTAGPVVVASSNRSPSFLDPALVRSGRLGFKVRFDAPDEDERIELFALFTRSIPTDPGIDWRHPARLTRGRTPADLRQLVDDAAGMALAAGRDLVEAEDVLTAIRRGGSIEPEDSLDPGTRTRIAIHEAGHTAVAIATRGASYVSSVRLAATFGATATGDEAIDVLHQPDDEIRDQLAISFGGIAAEIAILGQGSLGGRSDVSQTTLTALGRIAAGLADDRAPLDLDHLGRNVADSLKEALAAAIADPIAEARARAFAIVALNHEPIRTFAAALEAAGELTGDELRSAIDDAGFVPEGRRP